MNPLSTRYGHPPVTVIVIRERGLLSRAASAIGHGVSDTTHAIFDAYAPPANPTARDVKAFAGLSGVLWSTVPIMGGIMMNSNILLGAGLAMAAGSLAYSIYQCCAR